MWECEKCNRCFIYKSYYIDHDKIASNCELNNLQELVIRYSPSIDTKVSCKICKETFLKQEKYNHKKQCHQKRGI